MLASALGHLGQIPEAGATLANALRLRPNVIVKHNYPVLYRNPEDAEHILDGLRKAGWTG